MKTEFYSKILIAMLLVGAILNFSACGDDNESSLDKEEQTKYDEFVTLEMDAALKTLQMPIHRGINPPNIEGFFRMDGKFLATTNPAETGYLGSFIADMKIKFYDQNGLKVSLLGYEVTRGTDNNEHTHKGDGTFISGEGDYFSVFFEQYAIYPGDKRPTTLAVMSGKIERTSDGKIARIVNFRYAFLMKDNDGAAGVIANGQGRMIGDDDVITLTEEQFENTNGVKSLNTELETGLIQTLTHK